MLPTSLVKAGKLLARPSAIPALLTWRPFSLAAFELAARLRASGCIPKGVIDIGANEGQFTRSMLETFEIVSVLAFEPLESVARIYKNNFSGDERVLLRNQACGDKSDVASINVNSFSQSSSLMPLGSAHRLAFPNAKESGKQDVQIVRLDDVLESMSLPEPVLLKIDVQGYELRVLEGARRALGRVQHVLVETCFVPMYEGEASAETVIGFLNDAGFRFVGPLSILRDSHGVALQMDALFERRS